LRPYIMEQMAIASERGLPPMRPLFVDFASDPVCYQLEDQYLFGADLLVAPVLEADTHARNVYLPTGATWRDAWTDQVFSGGQWLSVQTPLDRIPLFLRDSASLPIKEV